MAAVAEGGFVAGLAAAEEDLFVRGRRVFDRVQAGVLVRSIAKRLFLRLPAGAPEIGFPLGHLDRIGGFLGDDGRVGHVALLGWRVSDPEDSGVGEDW